MTKAKKAALDSAVEAASRFSGRASEKPVADGLEAFGVDRRAAEAMAHEARNLAAMGRLPGPPAPPPREEAPIYPGDLDALRAVGPTPLLCAMFLCLRARPHPSGRIRYDDASLMACAGTKDGKAFRAAFAALAGAGLAKCAVVGSKNPTTTLSLPWAPEPDGEPTETVPFARGEGKRLAERLAKEERSDVRDD